MRLNLDDLETRLVEMLEDKTSALVFDTCAYHPSTLNISDEINERIDLTQCKGGKTLSNYNLLDCVRRGDFSDDTKIAIAADINSRNQEFITLINRVFQTYSNFLMPDQVRKELQNWVNKAEMVHYEEWKSAYLEGEKIDCKSIFSSPRKQLFFSRIKSDGDFACVDAQYEYLKSVQKFLEAIPEKRILYNDGSPEMNSAVSFLKDIKIQTPSKGDIKIIATSVIGAQNREYKGIKIITFDSPYRMARNLAQEPYVNIEAEVYLGYSLLKSVYPKEMPYMVHFTIMPHRGSIARTGQPIDL